MREFKADRDSPISALAAMKSGPARRRIQSLQVSKCSLGCPILDAFLGGGLSSGSITELVGGSWVRVERRAWEVFGADTSICFYLIKAYSIPIRDLPITGAGLRPAPCYPAGEATTAKTQLCLQALVHARLSLGGSGV